MRKNPIRPIYNRLIQSHWHCWKPVTKARPRAVGRINIFVIPKQPGLAYPGDRGWQQDGCSYYHNTGNNSHWGNGTMLWFPLPSQSEGRKESGAVMEVFIWQPRAAWVLYSGRNNFCHFNISLCCLKSQLQPSVVHEELAALDAKGWENLLISEEKMLRRTQSAFKASFPRSELN